MELRAYQKDGIARVEGMWAAGFSSVLAVAPTGAGKGTMASAMLHEAATAGQRALLLVHRREIVRDLRDRVAAMGMRVGTILPGERPDPSAPVQVASVQSLLSTPPSAYDLVVVDEAHHYAAKEWGAVVERIGAPRIVGFTATPQRADGKPLGDMFDALVDVVSYSSLLEAGLIVPCRVLRPEVPLDGNLAQEPADAYLRYARGSSAFIYVTSAVEAETACGRLQEAGVAAAIVSHLTPAAERAAAVSGLAAGSLSVIVNIYTMTEGIDVPRVDTVVLARPCRHASTYIQIVGRALRAHAGKRTAVLLDLTGTSYAHGLPVTDRMYALEGNSPISFAGGDVETLRAKPRRTRLTSLGLELVEASDELQAEYGKRVIDWSRQPLGRAPDQTIARALGVSRGIVTAAREARGIPQFSPRAAKSVDWDAQPLGKVPDKEIASKLGVKASYVVAARTRRGIPCLVSNSVNWAEQPLGKVPDGELAERLGVDKRAVARARRRLGIPALEPWIDWNGEVLLGRVHDHVLAEKYGVSRNTVFAARRQRGIAPYTEERAVREKPKRAELREKPKRAELQETRQVSFDFDQSVVPD